MTQIWNGRKRKMDKSVEQSLKEKENWDKIGYMVVNLGILLYGISMVYLFYKQTQWVDGSVYESDLPAHIKMIVEDGWYYSLTAFVYQALYQLPFGNLAISLFLSLCSVASIYLTYLILLKLNGMCKLGLGIIGTRSSKVTEHLVADKTLVFRSWFLLAAWALNLVMGCYVKGMADGRYIGMESASIWHNSTYIVMKAAALACILYYLYLEPVYQNELNGKKWGTFAVLLMICTGIKPSFLMVFAPMMALFLLADLLQGTPFKKVFCFGLTVIPSLLVILFQNAILFGADTGNGWELRPGYALGLHSGHPVIAAALSILFPLMVLVFHLRDLKKDRWYLGAWLMAGFGFLELFLFCETGGRASDGNFMWGYSFAILTIFAVSILKWWQDAISSGKNMLRRTYVVAAGIVFLYHLYCGIYFYLNLVQGVSYWMWD